MKLDANDSGFEVAGDGNGSAPGSQPDGVVSSEAGWMNKSQIANHLHVGNRTITRLMSRKILPYTKLRNLVRFDAAQCDKAFQKFEVRSMAGKPPPTANTSGTCPWRTKCQMAEHLGISLRSVTTLMHNRMLPFVKIDGLVRMHILHCDFAMRALGEKSLFDRSRRQNPIHRSHATVDGR